jgi:hypothetical protein
MGLSGDGQSYWEKKLLRELREQVLLKKLGGMSYSEMCVRMGWKVDETSRVTRTLGIETYEKNGKLYRARSISYEKAVLICKGAGIDPVELGL